MLTRSVCFPYQERQGLTMGLFGELIFGFMVGVGIVAGFKYLSDRRRNWRVRKTAAIKLLNEADEVDFKKLCGNNYPSHISFLTFDKVNWFNGMLVKFWPFVVQATQQRVKIALEPMLEMYRPPGISSLKIEKFHLGKVPPHIDGIRVQGLREGQVHMDVDFKWCGDGEIVLHVAVVGTELPIQLKRLSFYATIRVIFQLSEEIPCISALVVAILPNPKYQIGYNLKVIGGSTGSIPGLGDMIEDLVHSSIADQVEWPHRIVLPIGDTPADIKSDLGLKLQGKLRVTVVKATGLKNMEKIGKSDPYVRLYVRVLFKKKTRVINNNLNPVWSGAEKSHRDGDEVFEFEVEDTETQTLILQVKDDDIGTDKELGITSLSLLDLQPDKEVEITKKLAPSLDTVRVKDKGDRGTITVKLFYHPYTKEEQDVAMAGEKRELQLKEDLKKACVVESTMDAVGGGLKIVGTGVTTVGSGGVKFMGTGAGALGNSGVGFVNSGVAKASKLMNSGVKRFSSSHRFASSASPTPINGSPVHEVNRIFKSKEV